MEGFVSAFVDVSPLRRMSRAERHRLWEADRRAVADLWFGGDTDRAQEALEALPFSAIPGWSHVDEVARVFRGSAASACDACGDSGAS